MNKEIALIQLADRKKNKPEKIDNASLYAGSPMYFYCLECGHLSDVVPECYIPSVGYPRRLCDGCEEIKDNGWLV